MKQLTLILFFLLPTLIVQAEEVLDVDILVYDSSLEGSCESTPEEGCIRMQVKINQGDAVYTWLANSGGKGWKKCQPGWIDCPTGRNLFYFSEGRSTPSYSMRSLGS